jgi:uncharacterized protein
MYIHLYIYYPRELRVGLGEGPVHFADAVAVFEGENALTMPDEDSEAEKRFVTLGRDGLDRVLVVVYTWRGENIRVVSARRATKRERATYEG